MTDIHPNLSDADRKILDLAGRRYKVVGDLMTAARSELGLTARQYARALVRLSSDPAALDYRPLLIGRLRRAGVDRLLRVYGGSA